MKRIISIFLVGMLLAGGQKAGAQVTVEPDRTAAQLAQALAGAGVLVTNPSLVCPTAANGLFGGASNLGIDSGIVLATGCVATNPNGINIGINGPYTLFSNSYLFGGSDPDISAATGKVTYDACRLEFDVVPLGDTLRFNYVMGTEEYPAFRCTSFADGFGFYITGPGYTTATNIARLPNANVPITVPNLFCETNGNFSAANFTVNTGSYITYNAFSKVFEAKAAVQPCSTYHLKLVIADANDGDYDSGVFLKKGSLNSAPPVVTVSVQGGSVDGINGLKTPRPYAVRGCLNGTFTFRRDVASAQPLTIQYLIGGSAVNGVDYTAIPASVTIPANAISVDRVIAPLNGASGLKNVKLYVYSSATCSTGTITDSISLDIRDSLHAMLPFAASTLCNGQSQTITVTGDSLLNYSWSPSAGMNTTVSKSVTIAPTTTAVYQLTTSFPGSSCPAVHDTVRLTVPVNPVAAASNSPVCQNGALNLTASTTAAATYSWTGPGGFASTAQNPALIGMAPAMAGNYLLTVASGGCTFPPLVAAVSMATPPAAPAAISGSSPACTGTATAAYSIAVVPTATSYTWTVSGSGWSGTGTGLSFSPTAGTAAGTVSVVAGNSCGTSAPSTLSVAVAPVVTPAVSAVVSTGTTICTGTSCTFTATSANGGTGPLYQWKKNGVNVGTGGTTYSDNGLADGDAVSVVLTGNAVCASAATAASAVTTMTVKPMLVPAVSTSASTPYSICDGASVTFTASPVNGGAAPSYQWKKNGSNTGINSPAYTSAALANGDLITVVMTTSTQCYTAATATSSGPAMTVSSNLVPSVTLVSTAPSPACLGSSIAFLATAGNGGGTPSFQWYKNGQSLGSTGASYSTASWTSSDVFSVVMTSSEQCLTAATASSNPLSVAGLAPVTPSVSIASPSGTSVCAGSTMSFSATGTNGGPGATYLWERNGTAVASGPTYSSSLLANGDVMTVQMSGTLPCSTSPAATSNAIAVTVNPVVLPGINVNVTPPSNLCLGTARTFVANIAGGGNLPHYQWQLNGANVGTDDATYITTTLANADTVRCILTSSAACALTATQASNKMGVVVYPIPVPAVSITASPSLQLVAGQPVTFTASLTDGGSAPVLQWYKNNVGIPNATGATYTSSSLHDGDMISVQMLSSENCAPSSPVPSNTLTLLSKTAVPGSLAAATGLRLYPNPNGGRFTLEGTARPGQKQFIEVVNAVGQPVYRTELVPQQPRWQLQLNLAAPVAPGLYVLRLQNESGRLQQPFVTQ